MPRVTGTQVAIVPRDTPNLCLSERSRFGDSGCLRNHFWATMFVASATSSRERGPTSAMTLRSRGVAIDVHVVLPPALRGLDCSPGGAGRSIVVHREH